MGKACLHQSELNGAQTIYDRWTTAESTKYRNITFKLYFIFVLVMLFVVTFWLSYMFCLCLCPCSVYVPSRNLYLLGWPLKEHFLFKSPSECLCSVWGSGYVSLAHYYRRSITFQPCSFNVQSTVLSCSIYICSVSLQFCPTNSIHVPSMFS